MMRMSPVARHTSNGGLRRRPDPTRESCERICSMSNLQWEKLSKFWNGFAITRNESFEVATQREQNPRQPRLARDEQTPQFNCHATVSVMTFG